MTSSDDEDFIPLHGEEDFAAMRKAGLTTLQGTSPWDVTRP